MNDPDFAKEVTDALKSVHKAEQRMREIEVESTKQMEICLRVAEQFCENHIKPLIDQIERLIPGGTTTSDNSSEDRSFRCGYVYESNDGRIWLDIHFNESTFCSLGPQLSVLAHVRCRASNDYEHDYEYEKSEHYSVEHFDENVAAKDMRALAVEAAKQFLLHARTAHDAFRPPGGDST